MNAWTIYLLALAALCLLGFRMTRRWLHWITRVAVCAAIAAPLAIPATVPGADTLAPAWVVWLFETLFGSPAEAGRAAVPMLAVAGVALTGLVVLVFVRRDRQKNAPASPG